MMYSVLGLLITLSFILDDAWSLDCPSTYTQTNFILKNHIMSSTLVENYAECYDKCASTKDCHSMNFYDRTKRCELNKSSHLSNPIDLAYNEEATYSVYDDDRSMETCSDRYCSTDAICVIDKQNNTYECKDCASPFGMRVDLNNIPNSAITASSTWSSGHEPWRGRLNNYPALPYSDSDVGSWAANTNTVGQYLQVNLGHVVYVTMVATQGRPYSFSQYVKKYSLAYKNSDNLFVDYKIGKTVKYLKFLGYEKTSTTFSEELKVLGKPEISSGTPLRNDSQISEMQTRALVAFDDGKYQDFFPIWKDQVPASTQNMDSTCQKLEFNLHIYFAVYPITDGRHNKLELERSMRVFKSYLENRGAGLSQTTEFLPFYALPFVPDPTTHPSFKPIFTDSWSLELRSKLESFLSAVLKSQEKPKLFTLHKHGPDVLEKERKRHSDQMRLLQNQLSEVERRSALYFKKISRIQGDYHKLIGIAAELVDSLEDCVRGKMVTPEYLQGICLRLFSNATHESIDVTKPGTASSMLRASFAINQQHCKDEEEAPSTITLDYDKIRNDLASLPERKLALLLQALRWRLTRTTIDEVRDANVTAYIIHDLIGLTVTTDEKDGFLNLLNHSSDTVRQYAARLLNALASFSAGRTYFSQDFDLVYVLHTTLMAEPKTSLISENVLGTLQKLSLRRKLQTVMIKKGLIQWLVHLLDDHDSLSDYTLEYSVALLMNLSLRSSGKRTCIPNSAHVLKVLSDLLGHENQEIRPYVNGALYSILALPAIKEEARAMGMESILECFLVDENPDMKRQIQFIIKQLNTENPMATNDPESDDEDEDDDDDEGDAVDIELDKQEILRPENGELTGEELLATEYAMGRSPSKPSKMKNKLTSELGPDHPLTRPTTPGFRPADSIQSVQDSIRRPETSTVRPISSHERPLTSSGNRSSSKPTSKPSSKPSSRPTSNQSQLASRKESDKNITARESRQSHRSESAGSSLKDPFASRPKIPRDLSEQPLKAKSSSTPPLGRSMSPTRSSSKLNRTGTGSSSRKGSESGRPAKSSR